MMLHLTSLWLRGISRCEFLNLISWDDYVKHIFKGRISYRREASANGTGLEPTCRATDAFHASALAVRHTRECIVMHNSILSESLLSGCRHGIGRMIFKLPRSCQWSAQCLGKSGDPKFPNNKKDVASPLSMGPGRLAFASRRKKPSCDLAVTSGFA